MGFLQLLIILTVFSGPEIYCFSERGAFTGIVNLEKLYTLEDELITISDVILNQERALHGNEDVHGIHRISSIVSRVKDIHRGIVSTRNMTSYIVHPINVYHMTKRLVNDWSKVLETLQDSQSCEKAMQFKIENMVENLPTETNLKLVIESILAIQELYNISATEIASGRILQVSAFSEVSLDDAVQFAHVAYETEKYHLAADWLKYILDTYDGKEANFALSNVMNFLSSAYLQMQKPRMALSVLDNLLSRDPENTAAIRNKKYIIQKIEEGMTEDVSFKNDVGKTIKMLQRLCSSRKQVVKKKLLCFYSSSERQPTLFEKPSIKTEILSRRPLIVLYHNITSKSEQQALAHLGYEQMKEVLYKSRYSRPQGLNGLAVQDNTRWQWVSKLQDRLEHLPTSMMHPKKSHLMITNVGMHGLENILSGDDDRIGTFIVFLNEASYTGGNVAFPLAQVSTVPTKGSVLFAERKAYRKAVICPVIADTIWVGIYRLQVRPDDDLCYKDRIWIPSAR